VVVSFSKDSPDTSSQDHLELDMQPFANQTFHITHVYIVYKVSQVYTY